MSRRLLAHGGRLASGSKNGGRRWLAAAAGLSAYAYPEAGLSVTQLTISYKLCVLSYIRLYWRKLPSAVIANIPLLAQLSSASQGAMQDTLAASADSVVQPVHSKVPIIEVAFKNGMWWSIPMEMSLALYQKYVQGEDAGYTWDWRDSWKGSFVLDGEETSINRYVIDFRAWEQRNIDNDRRRSVRLVWVPAKSVEQKWTGEIPS